MAKRGRGYCQSSFILIVSADLRKTRDMNSLCVIGFIISIVPYDGAGFVKSPTIGEGRKHDSAESVVSA